MSETAEYKYVHVPNAPQGAPPQSLPVHLDFTSWPNFIHPNELPPPNGLTKITLQKYRDQRGAIAGYAAARADNGLVIGASSGQAVRFGIGGNILEWMFVDLAASTAYLKILCKGYLGREDVDFCVVDAESPLVVPGNPNQRIRM